jgi:hypothetical protein
VLVQNARRHLDVVTSMEVDAQQSPVDKEGAVGLERLSRWLPGASLSGL